MLRSKVINILRLHILERVIASLNYQTSGAVYAVAAYAVFYSKERR